MASIRTRITASYALALAGTIAAFTIVVGYERTQAASADLKDRAAAVADLATSITQQGFLIENIQQRVVRDSSIVGREFVLQFTALLDALPGYVLIGDSTRTIYQSASVRRLTTADLDQFSKSAFGLTPEVPAKRVLLDTSQVIIVGRFVAASPAGGLYRVVAGVSTAPLTVVSTQVYQLAFLAAPIILLLSVAIAWVLAGNMLQPIERMVNDVEAISDGRSLHRRIPVEEEGDEIGRLGMTLNAMISRLEASFAGLRRFTADASHELKTPLTVLRADIERAMASPPAGMEQLVALEEALQETTRMAHLVESLLTLARADEGRFDLHREVVALDPLVRDVAETANILGEAHDLGVSVTRIEPVSVLGDAMRLRQLFLNLVENAVKYSPSGGAVELSLELVNGAAVFSVKDSGIGIAGADLPFIFERFWRVDRARTRGEHAGTGLGLAICQWIAQAHGGSIGVSSRMGRGSTFSVTIPAAPGVHDGAAAVAAPPLLAAPSA